jgi:hypothetical protein
MGINCGVVVSSVVLLTVFSSRFRGHEEKYNRFRCAVFRQD